MRIALPVDGNSEKAKVCQVFGRTPYFLICDLESEEKAYIENKAAASQGGVGVISAQLIADNDISALLTPRCGNNAAQVLKTANVEIYRTNSDSVAENIEAFLNNNLSSLEYIHDGYHHHGGR